MDRVQQGRKGWALRAEKGWGFIFGEGQPAHSHQLTVWGSAVSSDSGSRAELQPPNCFPIFSVHWMAFPAAF